MVSTTEEQQAQLAPLFKSSAGQNQVPDQYIVVFKEAVCDVPAAASEMARAHGLSLGFVYQHAVKGYSATIAAGNSGDNAANYSPAGVNHQNVYTISAIGSNNCMPSWSNWGNPPVDWAAPGVSILSTKRGGGTTTMSGTSMAAPHVAGLLLLGAIRKDGTACNVPDGNPDPIAHR